MGDVSYFGDHGHVPLSVALLMAAVAGILLTVPGGSEQIMRLRATARKYRQAHHRAVKAEVKGSPKAGGSPDYREVATGRDL